jgi:hypothetical protein
MTRGDSIELAKAIRDGGSLAELSPDQVQIMAQRIGQVVEDRFAKNTKWDGELFMAFSMSPAVK